MVKIDIKRGHVLAFVVTFSILAVALVLGQGGSNPAVFGHNGAEITNGRDIIINPGTARLGGTLDTIFGAITGLNDRVTALEGKWVPSGGTPFYSNSLFPPHVATTTTYLAESYSHDVPNSIPLTAKEILVFAWIAKGSNSPASNDAPVHVSIYTQDSSQSYIQKLVITNNRQAVTSGNQAWTFNSDNMWFPLTSERKIHVTLPSILEGAQSGMEIIGYR